MTILPKQIGLLDAFSESEIGNSWLVIEFSYGDIALPWHTRQLPDENHLLFVMLSELLVSPINISLLCY